MTRLHTILITTDPGLARLATEAGVDEIMVDLEVMGKAERQGHLDTWKSGATPDDIDRIREAVPEGALMVRLNPLHDGTGAELDDAIARGADALMLPMFRSGYELARFSDMVAGRARIVPLVETAAALDDMSALASTRPDRIHFGLNDLALDLRLPFLFRPLSDGLLDHAARVLQDARIPFGIGGVARAGEGAVPANLILAAHARLGSTWTILSRAFHGRATGTHDLPEGFDFATELDRLQRIYTGHLDVSEDIRGANQAALRETVLALTQSR